MLSSLDSTDGTRWRRWIVAAGVALLILGAVATYSLLARGQDADRPRSAVGSDSAPSNVDPTEPDQPSTATALAAESDPETFARRVAEALFAWDTATITTPADLTERLVAVADPTGESSAGLVADIANYLPTALRVGRAASLPDPPVDRDHLDRGPQPLAHGRRAGGSWWTASRHDGVHDQRCSSPIGHLGRRTGPHRARRGLHGLRRLRTLIPRVPPAPVVATRRATGLRPGDAQGDRPRGPVPRLRAGQLPARRRSPASGPRPSSRRVPMDCCPARRRTRSTVFVTDRASGKAKRSAPRTTWPSRSSSSANRPTPSATCSGCRDSTRHWAETRRCARRSSSGCCSSPSGQQASCSPWEC